jgi:hypothetical protein
MDPALAALLGAAIGLTGSVLAPLVTSRHVRAARRRDVMQEAYAEGMRAMSDFPRVRDPGGYDRLRERLFEAQNHVRLVGAPRTSVKFDRFVRAINGLIDVALDEASKIRPFTRSQQRVESAFPQEARDKMTAAYEDFLIEARRDLGTDRAERRWIKKVIRMRSNARSAETETVSQVDT